MTRNNDNSFLNSVKLTKEVFTDNQSRWIKRQNFTKKQTLMIYSKYASDFLNYKAIFPNLSVPFKDETKWLNIVKEIIKNCENEEAKNAIIQTVEDECEIEIKSFMEKEGLIGLNSLKTTLANACRLIYIAEVFGYVRRPDVRLDKIIDNIAEKY